MGKLGATRARQSFPIVITIICHASFGPLFAGFAVVPWYVTTTKPPKIVLSGDFDWRGESNFQSTLFISRSVGDVRHAQT